MRSRSVLWLYGLLLLGPLLACQLASAPLLPTTTASAITPPASFTATAVPATAQATIEAAITAPSPTETPAPEAPETVAPTATATPISGGSTWPDLRPHYALTATVDAEAHVVQVQQTVSITNTTGEAWNDLVLHASAAYWPDLLALESLELARMDQAWRPLFTWDGTMLRIGLETPLAPAQRLALRLHYSLNLPPLDPLGWGPTGNAGWSPSLLQVGDWYPALVPYRTGAGWQTWAYRAVGDPVRSALADFDVTVVAPPHFTVVAAGRRGASGDTHYFRLRQSRAFAFLASPSYVRFEGNNVDVPIEVFVLAGDSEAGPAVVTAAEQSLALFAELFGQYPYDSLTIAQNGFLTAMEYSAFISLSGYAFTAYEGTPDSLLVSITAHEVAHQWWYGAVGSDQVDEPWLDEALAMISELLFYERYYPDLVHWWWWYRVDRWQPAGAVDVSVNDYEDSATFVHDMYGMSAYFMRDLRRLMGPEAFIAFLQSYYATHRHGWATGADFFEIALQFSSAEDLRPLTEQYFRSTPTPLTR